jgi:hypothetical protein
MKNLFNRIICILSHRKHYRLKDRGRVLNYMECSKCKNEWSYDRYSTGPK